MTKNPRDAYVIDTQVHVRVKRRFLSLFAQGAVFFLAILFLLHTQNIASHSFGMNLLTGIFGAGNAWSYYLALHIQLFLASLAITCFPTSLAVTIFPRIKIYIILPIVSIAFYAFFINGLSLGGVNIFVMVYYLPLYFSLIFINFALFVSLCLVLCRKIFAKPR